MLGEYGAQADVGAAGVMEKVAAVAERRSLSDTVRGYMLTAVAKLVAQARGPSPGTQQSPSQAELAARTPAMLASGVESST